ncbi:MAG: glycosyltransferase family 1 protein [Desulfovibrio sp.]|nr:glycosyltransferase family 1 protein [Desulfovibrio sp.]
MNILLIDCDLGPIPDHTVYRGVWNGQGGIVSIRYFLQQARQAGKLFHPDLLIQREHIGRRLLLDDLWELDCPKIFWAVDSHLNLYWQRFYGGLFDLVLTPHADRFAKLPLTWRLPQVRSFACPGVARPWRRHDLRRQHTAFVGVLDGNRDQRQRFAALLQKRHGLSAQRMPFEAMLDLYTDTRVLPNESICREFNFRIMEGASCGCCVLTEDIGEDLAVNFEPGKEVLTYGHAQELDDLLTFLRRRPGLGERIGCAAHRRVNLCHLPEHRCQALLRYGSALAAHSPQKGLDTGCFTLCCAQWARGAPESRALLSLALQRLEGMKIHWQILAMRLRLLLEMRYSTGQSGTTETIRTVLLQLLEAAPALVDDDFLDALTAALGAALRLDDAITAEQCYRLWRSRHAAENAGLPVVSDKVHLCLVWADILAASGRICQPGFHYDARLHCPETALEMLLMAEHWLDDETERRFWTAAMARITAQSPLASLALDYSARNSLYDTSDWRTSLHYAVCCLHTYRLEEGLAEADLARQLACSSGEEKDFWAELAYRGIRLPYAAHVMP